MSSGSRNANEMNKHTDSLDFILDAVSAERPDERKAKPAGKDGSATHPRHLSHLIASVPVCKGLIRNRRPIDEKLVPNGPCAKLGFHAYEN